MDPPQSTLGGDNLNKRFSTFSFSTSYATPSPVASTTEHSDKPAKTSPQPWFQHNARQQSVQQDTSVTPVDAEKTTKQGSARSADAGLIDLDTASTKFAERQMPDALYEDRRSNESCGTAEIHSKIVTPIQKILRKAVPKTPTEAKPRSKYDEKPIISTQSTASPKIPDTKEEPKSPLADRAPRARWLHKFRSQETKNLPIEDPQVNIPHGQQAVRSFFEDHSTDDDDDDDDDDGGEQKGTESKFEPQNEGQSPAFLGNAQQASFRRPVMVECRRSSRSPRMGIRDILSRGPSPDDKGDVSPLSEKGESMLNPLDLDKEKSEKEAKKSDLNDWPKSDELIRGTHEDSAANPGLHSNENADLSRSCTESHAGTFNKHPSSPNLDSGGLRSHPMQRAAKRQVTFPISIQAIKQRKWEREDVISTPYPSEFSVKHETGWGKQEKRNKEKEASLTVVLYSPKAGVPKVEQIFMPAVAHKIPFGDSPKGAMVIKNRHFDDFALANAIFGAYKNMRGVFLAKYGARTVKDLRLLGYEHKCQLSQRRVEQQCFKVKDEEDGFAQNKLMELYCRPSSGKGKWIWWAWVQGLPENQGNGLSMSSPSDKVALELVEGWSLKRLSMALGTVVLCCVSIAIIWIACGVSRLATPSLGEKVVIVSDRPDTAPTPTATSSSPSSATTNGIAIADAYLIMPDISASPDTVNAGISPTTPAEPQASAFGVLTRATSAGAAMPSVVVHDTAAKVTRTVAASELATSLGSVAAPSGRSEKGSQADAGSRVGSGVGLGALILLFGLIIIALWMATSYLVW